MDLIFFVKQWPSFYKYSREIPYGKSHYSRGSLKLANSLTVHILEIPRAFFISSEQFLTQLYFCIVWENSSGSIISISTASQKDFVFQKYIHLWILGPFVSKYFLYVFFIVLCVFLVCSKGTIATYFSALNISFIKTFVFYLQRHGTSIWNKIYGNG